MQGRRAPVVVSLAHPEPDPKSRHGDWRCAFRVTGLGSRSAQYAHGIDAFQALACALEGIRATLEPHRSELSWIGGEIELAFPRVVPWLPGGFARRIETLIDRELASFARRLEQRAKKREARSRT
jgi:hypothetical protein